MKKKILTLTALSAILVASNAHASGFHLKEQSVSGLGTAFAGSSSGGQDISASYFNPAVLTRYKGSQIVFGATYVAPTAKLKYARSTAAPAQVDGPSSDVVSNAVVPNFYASKQLNDDIFLGISFNAPFGLVTKYDDNWAGRDHGTLSDLKTYTMTPMLAYKMDDKMSVGVGAQIQHVKARLRNGVVAGQGQAVLEGDTTDAGYVFGAQYEWRKDTRFGAGYRSRIHHKLKGDIDLTNVTPMPAMNGSYPINAELTTPAVASFGITHDLNEKVSLMAEFQRTYWSVFDELRIKGVPGGDSVTPEKWKNTNFYSIGASYQLNDEWKLRGGLGFDKSAVKKEYRTPRIPDSNRNWYSLGAQYKPNEKMAIDMGYTFIRAADGAKINLANKVGGSLQADYKSYVHIIGVGVTYNF
ncbi:MAG: OmpP1/FadL family transporter [Alphaproteobacteria bacterium]